MLKCFLDHRIETPVVLVRNLLVAGNTKFNPTSVHNKWNLLAHITVKSRYMVVFRQTLIPGSIISKLVQFIFMPFSACYVSRLAFSSSQDDY